MTHSILHIESISWLSLSFPSYTIIDYSRCFRTLSLYAALLLLLLLCLAPLTGAGRDIIVR